MKYTPLKYLPTHPQPLRSKTWVLSSTSPIPTHHPRGAGHRSCSPRAGQWCVSATDVPVTWRESVGQRQDGNKNSISYRNNVHRAGRSPATQYGNFLPLIDLHAVQIRCPTSRFSALVQSDLLFSLRAKESRFAPSQKRLHSCERETLHTRISQYPEICPLRTAFSPKFRFI